MRKIKLHNLIIIFIAIFFFHSIAEACTCGETKPCEANAAAFAVFVGKVTKLSTSKVNGYVPSNAMSTTFTSNRPVARLQIEETFRGVKGNEVDVFGEETTCDYYFEQGKSYLVYAIKGKDGDLYTSVCSRTSPIAEAKKDLIYLRSQAKTSKGGTIIGTVSEVIFYPTKGEWKAKPIPNAKVILENGSARFQILTNAKGEFELQDIPVGKYVARTEPLTNMSRETGYDGAPASQWTVEISQYGCKQMWFSKDEAGEVSGKVVDGSGNLLKDIEVQLIPTDPKLAEIIFRSVSTNEKGEFTFYFVPHGNYYLGFDLKSSSDKMLYYPETTEQKKAKIFVINKDQKIGGLVLRHVSSP